MLVSYRLKCRAIFVFTIFLLKYLRHRDAPDFHVRDVLEGLRKWMIRFRPPFPSYRFLRGFEI